MKKGIITGIVLIAIVLIGYFVFMPTQPTDEKEVIKIGAILPLTGPVAIFGQWAKNGIELGLDEYKKNNLEVDDITVLFEDSKFDARAGLSAFNKLVNNDKVDAVIVAMSKVAIPILELANRDTPVLLQDVTLPNITEKYDNVIRHFIQSDREATILSKFASDSLKLKTCGVLYVNDEAGVGAKNAFVEFFSKKGKVRIIESFESRTQDVKTQVSKIIKTNPECLFIFGNGPSWALALRTIRELNYKGIILTNTALYIPNFRKMAGNSIEGVYFTYPYMDTSSISTKRFVEMYEKKFDNYPPLEAAYGYDLVKLILTTQNIKGLSLIDRLTKLNEFEGAFGKLSIPENKDIISKVALAQYNSKIINLKIQ